jgi:hypothetical protein
MFHTYPEAELPLPPGLAVNSERTWHRIEFGLHLPYYLVTLDVETEDGPFVQTVCFSSLRGLNLGGSADAGMRLRHVCLMSPSWMNGTGHYHLDELSQVWSDESYLELVFVLGDGRRY